MTSVAKSFTAVANGQEMLVRHGEFFNYSLSGTFVGTLLLQKTTDGGQNWETLLTKTAAANGKLLIENQGRSHCNVRWRCSAYTSGTAVTSVSDAPNVLQEFKDSSGQTVLEIRSDGINTPQGAGLPSHSTISAVEYSTGIVRKTVLTCVATPIVFADDAGVAQYGGVKIYDFPEGLINTLGAVVSGVLTLPTPFIDTYTGVMALGTVTATTGATLTSTEADILQSTAITQAVAKVATTNAISIATALTESGGRHLDGTATAKDAYLNYAIADDAAHAAETGLFTGVITLTWINEGDK